MGCRCVRSRSSRSSFVAILAVILGVQLFLAGFLGELVNRNATDRNSYLVDRKINIEDKKHKDL